MGFVMLLTQCAACGTLISCNPNLVPSVRVNERGEADPNGNKEPICKNCFDRWNFIHRTSKGLPAIELHPEAYGPADEREL